MAKFSADRIAHGVRFFDRTLGRLYDIRIHNAERLPEGRAIYTANHFHHFDPVFILYAVARLRGVLAHQLAKPSLFKIPLIGRALHNWGTIVTPRPSHGEEISFADYERMKDEIETAIGNDEALSFAYAGTMTDNFGLDDEALADEQRRANHGLLSLVRKIPGLCLVPVAVETYQKRTNRIYFDALLALSGLFRFFPRRRRFAVDISIGEPIFVDTFLAQPDPATGARRNRASVIAAAIDAVWSLRHELRHLNSDDASRSLDAYR